MHIIPSSLPEFDNHEVVVDLGEETSSLLQGFIALHSTRLGSALGGTRVYPYSSKRQAVGDVLKLSRAMTYKCAITGLHFGGGKGVIIFDPKDSRLPEVLKAYATKVSELQGKFYTGEDVGLSEENVQYMLRFSPYFVGKTGLAGDPSYFAALSVFISIEEALRFLYGRVGLAGKTCAIKGVGKTGSALARLLLEAGAVVTVADLDPEKSRALQQVYPQLRIASPEEIERMPVDIFAPCAQGDDIRQDNLDNLKAKIIVGTANNQLESDVIGDALFRAGVLYVPDYIANAGGLINVADELLPGGYTKSRVMAGIEQLRAIIHSVLEQSQRRSISTHRIADEMAEVRLKNSL